MLTYISALLSGKAEPFWPHLLLISGSVLAGIAVGAGIIFEGGEYSPSAHRVAKWLVILGVVVESVCTVCLFVFDEGISNAQQSRIISLQHSNEFLLSQGQELEALAGRARRESAQALERAAQLEKDAAVARASVAEANARAAEANEKVAKAELELAKVEVPRHFQPAARFETVGKKYLMGVKFDLTANAEIEPMMLAIEVRQ